MSYLSIVLHTFVFSNSLPDVAHSQEIKICALMESSSENSKILHCYQGNMSYLFLFLHTFLFSNSLPYGAHSHEIKKFN